MTTIALNSKEESIHVLLNELNSIKQDFFSISIQIFILIKTKSLEFLLSYKEYSYDNIKTFGLSEVLMIRALRFFKLEEKREQKERKPKTRKKRTLNYSQNQEKIKNRRVGVLILKKVLYPFYGLLLFIHKVKNRSRKPTKKMNVFIRMKE